MNLGILENQEFLEASFVTVTPVFCSGANPDVEAEMRAPSIRGVLRWFYRAIDPRFRENELVVFGASAGASNKEARTSPVAVRLMEKIVGNMNYSGKINPPKASSDGLCYLGYSLYLGGNNRVAIPPGKQFCIKFFPTWYGSADNELIKRAWVSSIWLFGNLGGLGSRSRRGFGTIALKEWKGSEKETGQLPLPYLAKSPEEWLKIFNSGYNKIKEWFSGPMPSGAFHHHLPSPPSKIRLEIWKAGKNSWEDALREAGNEFRNFRAIPGNHKPELLAGFGLPISFRRHPAEKVNLRNNSRSASRLIFRVLRISGKYHAMCWKCEGKLFPPGDSLHYKGPYTASFSDIIIDNFFNNLKSKGIVI